MHAKGAATVAHHFADAVHYGGADAEGRVREVEQELEIVRCRLVDVAFADPNRQFW